IVQLALSSAGRTFFAKLTEHGPAGWDALPASPLDEDAEAPPSDVRAFAATTPPSLSESVMSESEVGASKGWIGGVVHAIVPAAAGASTSTQPIHTRASEAPPSMPPTLQTSCRAGRPTRSEKTRGSDGTSFKEQGDRSWPIRHVPPFACRATRRYG